MVEIVITTYIYLAENCVPKMPDHGSTEPEQKIHGSPDVVDALQIESKLDKTEQEDRDKSDTLPESNSHSQKGSETDSTEHGK